MNQPLKDPFQMAEEEQDVQEQDYSPAANDDVFPGTQSTADEDNNQNNNLNNNNNDKKNTNANNPSTFPATPLPPTTTTGKNKDDVEEEEEENMDMELGKFPPGSDPDKMANMQAILSQFTEEQMSRVELTLLHQSSGPLTDMDEHANSLWCLLPHDILWLIIQLVDFIDFHRISTVCKKWKLACKRYCPPAPNDPIPWLLTKYPLPTKSTSLVGRYIRIYRPLTNKTYKINLPDIGAESCCLHSKDAWLLLRDEIHWIYRFVLLNLFTQDRIELPTLRLRSIVTFIEQGTFSTASESPNCVILHAINIIKHTQVLYAWKIGSDTWNTYNLCWGYDLRTFWLCDDHLYFFFTLPPRVMVFDNDLNLKRSNYFTFWIDSTFNITESNKELFAVRDQSSDSYKFDRSTLDWAKVNVKILIGFKRPRNCNIGFMVRDQWDEVYLQMKNLKNYSCQIMVKGEQVIVDADCDKYTWLHL